MNYCKLPIVATRTSNNTIASKAAWRRKSTIICEKIRLKKQQSEHGARFVKVCR
jgi:hypothetical protein